MPHFVKDIEEIRERARQKIEDGAVTSTYTLDKDKSIEILNEALATEIVCVLRYMHHYFMATGVHGAAARDEFKEHADEEREHADRVAERIQQLGGKPDYNPKSLLERSVSHYVEGENLADMIREDLVAERVVIDVYREMIKYFGQKDPTTRTLIEDLLEEEEEHASDLSDLLFVVNPSTGETAEQDPGTEIGESDKEERMDHSSNGGKSSGNGNSRNTKPTNKNNERLKTAIHNPEAEEQEAEVALKTASQRSQQQPKRTQPVVNAAQPKGGQPSRPSNGNSRDKNSSRNQEAGSHRRQPQPAHAPGTTGRVMARRGRNEIEPADDDIAIGGQMGTNKSPKIVNKDRKKNKAA